MKKSQTDRVPLFFHEMRLHKTKFTTRMTECYLSNVEYRGKNYFFLFFLLYKRELRESEQMTQEEVYRWGKRRREKRRKRDFCVLTDVLFTLYQMIIFTLSEEREREKII